jgi:hypothetical protein
VGLKRSAAVSEKPAAALRKQNGAAGTKRLSLRNAAAGPADTAALHN